MCTTKHEFPFLKTFFFNGRTACRHTQPAKYKTEQVLICANTFNTMQKKFKNKTLNFCYC